MIPITRPTDPGKDAGKRPAQPEGWTKGCPRDEWPQYARCGLGILTATTPTVDIDTRDPDLAAALQELVDRHLGEAPVRYGEAPKRALPFRLAGDPFPKRKIAWRAFPGSADVGRPKDPGLEVLAAGQQFVALGTHPGTRKPYWWQRDPELSLPQALLPPLDHRRAEKLMRVAARMLRGLGADLISGRDLAEPTRKTHGPARPPVCATPDHEQVRDALQRLGNPDLHYDDWVRLGIAIKAAIGDGGRDLWCWWSSLSAKDDPDLTARKWETFKPDGRIGAGSIFYALRRH